MSGDNLSIDSNIEEIYKSISLSEFKEKYDYSNWLKLKEAIKSIYKPKAEKRFFLIVNLWNKDYNPQNDEFKLFLEENYKPLIAYVYPLNLVNPKVFSFLNKGKRIAIMTFELSSLVLPKLRKKTPSEYKKNLKILTPIAIKNLAKALEDERLRIFAFGDFIPSFKLPKKIIDEELLNSVKTITKRMLLIFHSYKDVVLKEPKKKGVILSEKGVYRTWDIDEMIPILFPNYYKMISKND